MAKVHLHNDQFDGVMHPTCGRGDTVVTEAVFEATPPRLRCQHCDRYWFPNGQPDWHLQQAQRMLAQRAD